MKLHGALKGRSTEFETNKDATNEEIKRVINGTKNAIKHMNDGEPKVTIDPIFEAKRHIDDAVVSSEKLGLEKTPTAWRYQDYRNTEMHSNRVLNQLLVVRSA